MKNISTGRLLRGDSEDPDFVFVGSAETAFCVTASFESFDADFLVLSESSEGTGFSAETLVAFGGVFFAFPADVSRETDEPAGIEGFFVAVLMRSADCGTFEVSDFESEDVFVASILVVVSSGGAEGPIST
ncbi:hypothetical protein [Arthrobacter rhombi]|uniref:hypothetical protein n=1 Tax=Arthrobacter rhombi TaxID=71253 RepID=UPI001FEA18DD|nr:hypothetical protein [Arthrobacter rhombi]